MYDKQIASVETILNEIHQTTDIDMKRNVRVLFIVIVLDSYVNMF
jgi:hypothetical protein